MVDALLAQLAPGGKAVFVDYHGPALWPRCADRSDKCRRLEPFAESRWHDPIEEFAADAGSFRWRTKTFLAASTRRRSPDPADRARHQLKSSSGSKRSPIRRPRFSK